MCMQGMRVHAGEGAATRSGSGILAAGMTPPWRWRRLRAPHLHRRGCWPAGHSPAPGWSARRGGRRSSFWVFSYCWRSRPRGYRQLGGKAAQRVIRQSWGCDGGWRRPSIRPLKSACCDSQRDVVVPRGTFVLTADAARDRPQSAQTILAYGDEAHPEESPLPASPHASPTVLRPTPGTPGASPCTVGARHASCSIDRGAVQSNLVQRPQPPPARRSRTARLATCVHRMGQVLQPRTARHHRSPAAWLITNAATAATCRSDSASNGGIASLPARTCRWQGSGAHTPVTRLQQPARQRTRHCRPPHAYRRRRRGESPPTCAAIASSLYSL